MGTWREVGIVPVGMLLMRVTGLVFRDNPRGRSALFGGKLHDRAPGLDAGELWLLIAGRAHASWGCFRAKRIGPVTPRLTPGARMPSQVVDGSAPAHFRSRLEGRAAPRGQLSVIATARTGAPVVFTHLMGNRLSWKP